MDGEYLSQKRVGPEIDSNALFAYHSGDGKRIRFEYHKQQAHHYPSSPHMNMNYMMMGSWSPVVNLPDIPPTDHSCSSAYHCCCHHQMKNHMVDHLFESGTAMISSPANVITCLQNQMQNHSVCVPTNYNIGFQDTSPTVDCFQNEIGFWNNTPQEMAMVNTQESSEVAELRAEMKLMKEQMELLVCNYNAIINSHPTRSQGSSNGSSY